MSEDRFDEYVQEWLDHRDDPISDAECERIGWFAFGVGILLGFAAAIVLFHLPI